MTPYDRELLRVLASRGIVLGPDGTWQRDPQYTGPNLPTDAALRYLNEGGARKQHDTNARLRCQWVENLAHVVEALGREGERAEWPYMAVFWLRLHGLLTEIRFGHTTALQTAGIDPDTYIPNRGSLLEYAIAEWRAIDPVRREFTDDELIYADYRRHTEGHPTQRSYDVRMSNGQINDRHGVPSLAREFTVAELDAAIVRVLSAYPSENSIAVTFARRVRRFMPPLVAVMRIGAT